MKAVRLGAVGYLNARPLVFGLNDSPRFDLRFDVPSECARLLHAGDIDVGLIPSIEYQRSDAYRIAPDLAIASRGPVASVALFTRRSISDVRSIAMDTSSRTSVALVRLLCARLFKIDPAIESREPDLPVMLDHADAALLIGDPALVWTPEKVRLKPDTTHDGPEKVRLKPDTTHGGPEKVRLKPDTTYGDVGREIEKIDLGEAWTSMTGLPFVWAFWAGRGGALTAEDVEALQAARDRGVQQTDAIARDYFRGDPRRQDLGAKYLRDNIKYHLGADERAGLELFYRYAAELGLAPRNGLRFYP